MRWLPDTAEQLLMGHACMQKADQLDHMPPPALPCCMTALDAWRQVQTCRARAWLHDAAEQVLAGARLVR